MTRFKDIGVVGGGAWGTALAATAQRAGARVTLWAREADIVASIAERHENVSFLPGVTLHPSIAATGDLARVARADALLLVVPAQYVRGTAQALAAVLPDSTPIVIAAKGIEMGSGATMGEVLAETLPRNPVAVLSGPTFAIEVARGLPTAVTLAAADQALGSDLVAALGTQTFRPYLSDDPIGCEIGGAVKNVLAIACGIVSGRGLGDNARAALITRGLAEMVRLATAKGGRPATLMGLSGLGDLVLTCTAMQSRNCSLGAALGAGRSLADVLGERRSVAEGVASAAAVAALASRLGLDMPIVAAVDAILHRGAAIDAAISALLARPFKAEER
ncbi:MAG TPA: NAD(P)H-dependent glycerol-3-phosphate dehydrogenase [Aliidongia sp.]|uniref:NAD(P)H-dependent glycerol-3-phosphate dehydrogenase n=1 Tax=Aliidongia sp. TaxID=1914230 RepID=UPI002DDDB8F7|nr:NAD(P)H-dependent glycerol-3-phosphate dehydrogenase [Aliidongia sp.]HEV2674884.1 NAD(P)H-dependent glycerol-3-phosphate dehydrogenase [Aliidongia sp.]